MKKSDYHRKRPGVLVRFVGDQIVRVKEAAARECLAVETWMRQKCLIAANMTRSAPLLDGIQSKRLASRKNRKLKQGRKHGWTKPARRDRKTAPMKKTPAPAAAGGALVKPG